MITSEKGIELIKEFEGFEPNVYKDVGGLKTIGYGHLLKKHEENFVEVNEKGALMLLRLDLIPVHICIKSKVKVDLNQNQFDALCCLIYNIGINAFSNSTLLSKINLICEPDAIAKEWLRWSYVNKQFVYGLKRRRKAEIRLYQENP